MKTVLIAVPAQQAGLLARALERVHVADPLNPMLDPEYCLAAHVSALLAGTLEEASRTLRQLRGALSEGARVPTLEDRDW
jgi:hypothetical protein